MLFIVENIVYGILGQFRKEASENVVTCDLSYFFLALLGCCMINNLDEAYHEELKDIVIEEEYSDYFQNSFIE